MTGHNYGPHRPEDAPITVVTGAGSREQEAPRPEALIRQRVQVNTLAHGSPLPTKATVLAAVSAAPLGAITPEEWATFTAAVKAVARDGVVRQNDIRPLIRGRIFHKHIGACYSRATALHLLEPVAREGSADREGRNTHHDSGVYRLGAVA